MKLACSLILSIDLQNEYRASGAYPVEGYDQILGNASSIIGAARRADLPVIHAQAWVGEDHLRGNPLLRESMTPEQRSGVADSIGARICEEVQPAVDERVVRKRWSSAFLGTPLDAELRRRGAENLLIMGVWSDSCVRATMLDAVRRNYRVWVVKDACGSATNTMHRAAILDMANRLYGGGVLRTPELLRALRNEPYSAWRCSRPVEFRYTLETLDALYESL